MRWYMLFSTSGRYSGFRAWLPRVDLRSVSKPFYQEFSPVMPGLPDSQNSLNLKLFITIQKHSDWRGLAATIRPVSFKQRNMEDIMNLHCFRQQQSVSTRSYDLKNLKWTNIPESRPVTLPGRYSGSEPRNVTGLDSGDTRIKSALPRCRISLDAFTQPCRGLYGYFMDAIGTIGL